MGDTVTTSTISYGLASLQSRCMERLTLIMMNGLPYSSKTNDMVGPPLLPPAFAVVMDQPKSSLKVSSVLI